MTSSTDRALVAKKQNLLFNQLTALGKRLVMVLTMLLMLGIGQAWGAVTPLPLPYSWGAGDGKSKYTNDLGCTLNGLGSDYNTSGTLLRFDHTGDYLIIQLKDAPGTLSYNIKGNTFSGGTFTIQESADGTQYSNLGTYSEDGTQTHNLSASTRYIKFIYTTKSSGNIGLGTISITEATGGAGGNTDDGSGGGNYAITFATGNNTTATTSSVQLSTMIEDGTENVVSFSIDATDKYVYHKGAGASNATGSGLRLGKSGGKGKITFNLSEQISSQCLSSISVTTGAWDANVTVSLLVNGENSTLTTASAGNTISYTPQNPSTNLSSITLYASARAFIKKITIETTSCTTEPSVTLNPNGGIFASDPEGWTKDGNNYKKEDVTGAITLPTPTKAGYNFDGWYDGTTKVNSSYTPTETVTLVAKWIPITYTIIFGKNNASATGTMSNQIFDYGTAQNLTQNTFILTGYTFSGWNTKADGSGTSYADKAQVTNLTSENGATIILYAQWKVQTFTVSFNANGGSGTMSNPTFNYNVAQNLTANSFTRTGYTFTGWNTNADGSGTSYADNQSVTLTTAGLTLYAQWTANTYTVEFNANGGTGMMDNQSFTYDQSKALNANAFTRTNYAFKNWNTKADGSGTAYTDKQSVSNLTTTNGETVTLYAQWTQLHTITWMVGGSELTTGSQTTSVENGKKITAIPDAPDDKTLADCGATKFMGWSTDNIGSTPDADAPTDLFTTVAEAQSKIGGITENKTFYAVFATAEETPGGTTDETTSVNIGTYATANSWEDKKTYSSIIIDENIMANASKSDGNTSNTGYYSSSNAHWRFYQTEKSSLTITAAENCTIKTVKVTYTIDNSGVLTYNGSNQSSNTLITVNATSAIFGVGNTGNKTNGQVRISEIEVTYSKPGGTITTYSNYVTNCCNTQAPTNGAYTCVSGTEIKLTWDDAANTNRYHITGGNLSAEGVYETNKYYNIIGLTECEEYTFYVSAYPEDGCESESIAITAQPFSGAKTVTFNYNGNGQANTTASTSCGNTSITLPTPTYSGYRFMGWYTAANGGDKVNENPYTPTSDITLYAQWEKEYNVTYNANGGSTTCAGGAYIAGETVTVCTTNPSRTGHTFTGWTYSPSVTITDGKFVMPASDVTITAQWQVKSYTVTWNPNGGNWGGSTASIVETYEYGATIVQPAAPQRDGYRFTGWSPAVSSPMPAGDKTYTAQWKQNYTITFYDGDDVTPWTQTKDAESINLTEYVGTLACDDYQFAGWSTADTKYNDETANITTWVTGNYTPTANIDLYAVYSKGAVINDFTLNCVGGVYEIWEKGTNQHMAGRQNGGGDKFYTTEWYNGDCTSCEGTDGAPFTITKVAENTYTLQNADGQYITRDSYDGNADELEIEDTWENADRYKWTISNGTNGTWRFTNKAATTYALVFYDKYFQLRTANNVTLGSSDYDLELTPAASNVYQSNPNCGPYYIIFNTHGGEFIQGEYAYGEEQTGLTETTYSKFPAAELDGYTFAGWKDGSPIDDEITADNASDAPYLKQAGEDLVVSSNKTYHAVYYYYDEEEDIDFSKEFTTSIYAEVNGMKYFLAGTPSSGTMSSTTDCGYVSEVTITPGTGANAGKYKITVNDVGMAPEAGETDLVAGTAWWTITERSVGSGEYKISGQDKKNIVLFSSSWGHYTYNQGSEYGNNYYYPRFGKCLQHHWTSNPVDVYTMTWKIYEDIHATTTVQSGKTIAALPTNPLDNDLGCCADKFIGWTASAAQTISKEDVFTTLADAQTKFPNITEDKTFYAVFATAAQGVGTSIADFSEMGYENATAVIDPIVLGDGEGHGDATITLEKAQSSSNAPTYYTDGEAVRIYAGGTITIASTYNNATIKNIVFTFAGNDVVGENTITANSGTYDNGTWTGDASTVTFTIAGSTGHRRIASITVTTGVAGSQYTNYVTQCELSGEAAIGEGIVAYANEGTAIAVNCGNLSPKNTAATLTFPGAKNLTCPVTLTASEGFVLSTNKQSDTYQSKITIKPIKSGDNTGKLKNVYVRAIAPAMFSGEKNGTITVSGGEIATPFTVDIAAEVSCNTYTITLIDHLGNTIGTPTSHYEGDIIELPTELEEDACSENYTFDGWSTAPVEYGSLIYNKVSFLYTMPAANVILYPVYQCNKTADYHRVTSDLGLGDVDGNNWAGDYLIAYSDQIFADGYFSGTNEGSLGDKMHIFNPNKTEENLVGDVVKAGWGDNYYITLETVEGGYVLKSRDNNTENGKIYNYYTNNTNESGQISVTDSPKTAAKYAIQVVFVSQNDIRLSLSGNAAGAVFRYGSTGFRFYKDCGGNPIYLYKKSPLYTTSLICGTIEIQENDIVVTSTKDQSVKVSVPVKLTSSYDGAVTISGANVNSFSVITKENVPVNTEEVVNVELIYSPQAYDQLDTETITLTATNGATTSFQITGRSLPESFAIVAKVGNNWFALPSQGLNSETTPVGYPVLVDNNDNPTAVTSLPITAEWSLRNVYKVNGQNDRFTANGENLVFVNVENKTLYANNGNANIQTYAEYTNYATTNPERYEWVPTTTDLTNYTLKNVGRDKDLSINVNATFGTHASNIASNNLRFLRINATYNPFDMQVVEWYPTKVLVQTEVNLTSVSVSATVGSEAVANPVVTKKGGKLYEISGLPLESNPTKILTISYDTYSCSKVIPIIISRATKSVTDAPFTTLTTSVYNYSDLVVRDGATLTINGTKQAPDKFVNVTIYPTAKIVVPENKQLSVYSLTFFGGIGEIYDGSAYTLNKYGVPQLSLKGTLGKTVTTMDYIMRVDLEQMYQVGVPYDVNLNEITYWDGASIALGTALYVSAYDGAARARLDWDNTWQWEVNFVDKVLKAGIGYTISAEPQVAGDTYSILRMPMKNNINSGNTETQKATINVTAHGMSDKNLTDNHKGWNYLSNPYMTSISGAESGGVDNNNIVVGYLVETGKGPWEWKNDTYRYVTIPYDDGTNYYQQKFSEAILLPFKSFFLQIATDGELSFALASRLNAPMRHLQQQENAPREVEFELLLSNDAQSDNTGLLISEEFTPAYEINADLEKMTGTMSVYTIYNGYQLAYNALSPLNAMEEIPLGYVVPTTGEYTFTLDERGDLEDIEHIYLLDHDSSITTDLMEDIYTFTATEKKNDHRFAISVILKAEEEEETPTHLETLEWESDHPYKFIYQDKMYILRNGVIYDAMGKQVQTINK